MGNAIRINPTAEIEYRQGSIASGWQVYNVRTALRAAAGLYRTREEAELAAEALHVACESLAAEDDGGATMCQWFAGCRNVATGATAHPVLGNVPTCDRCHIFATK